MGEKLAALKGVGGALKTEGMAKAKAMRESLSTSDADVWLQWCKTMREW